MQIIDAAAERCTTDHPTLHYMPAVSVVQLSKQVVRLLCAYSAEQCKDAADSKELLAQAYTESSHCINLHGA
eukprot:4014-Heterococcus_DN1.PRE.2